jgi:hypothetical protein
MVDHLRQAITHMPRANLNHMMVEALLDGGKFDAARAFIDDAETLAPVHPVKAMIWQRDLDGLREFIRQSEQIAATQPRS